MENYSQSSDFPTVGESVLGYVGSGAAHPNPKYTMSTPRGTEGRGASPTGTFAARGNKLKEYSGPKCSIQATLYHQNAAEASATQRNTRLMPAAAGVNDFWKERARQGQSY